MAASVVGGPGAIRSWTGERGDDMHRTFKVKQLVKADFTDGPKTVMDCPDLPTIGDTWAFYDDEDVWAFCWPTRTVTPFMAKEGDPGRDWEVESTFSTKPIPNKRCGDQSIEDPLLEPQKYSGSFVKYVKEAVTDMFGDLILTSSHEQVRGPQVEFDANRPTVKIEQNVPSLELELFSQMVDTVNDAPLWGLNARCVKLSNVSWERLFYGDCYYYYKRVLDFDISFNTFDRCILDEGTMVLNGEWSKEDDSWVVMPFVIGGPNPDPSNPLHFIQFPDRMGNTGSRVILNGAGLPAYTDITILDTSSWRRGLQTKTGSASGAGNIGIFYYPESNMLLLDVPTSF